MPGDEPVHSVAASQQALPFELVDPVSPPDPEPPAPVLRRHRRARHYILRVREGGGVSVTMPPWGTKREANAFAANQRGWILEQLRRLKHESRRQCDLPPSEVVGIRSRAERELPARLLELARDHWLTVSRVSVRDQKRRWGSCSPGGHICLNWRLALMPDWIRDYVMIHELMHLKRMDHSPRFWALVRSACPRYQEARAWLRAWPAAY